MKNISKLIGFFIIILVTSSCLLPGPPLFFKYKVIYTNHKEINDSIIINPEYHAYYSGVKETALRVFIKNKSDRPLLLQLNSIEVLSKKHKFDSIDFYLSRYNKDTRLYYLESIGVKDYLVLEAKDSLKINGNKRFYDKKYLDSNDTVDLKIKLNNTEYYYILAR